MKLIAIFLLVNICKCNVSAWWWAGSTRITHQCGFSVGQECGGNPYCPYPNQRVSTGHYCCCNEDQSFGYQYKATLITAVCGTGVPMQECQDFPYCEDDSTFYRSHDRCCCNTSPERIPHVHRLLKPSWH